MKSYKVVFTLLFVVLVTVSVSSCKKKCEVAGTGGNVTLVVKPQHHGKAIYNQTGYLDTVYLKFNTQDSPSVDLASYDTYFVGEAGEDHVHIEGLKCGDYYIYAVGLDTTGNLNERVTGGIPFSFEEESGEINLPIPLTE